MDRSEQEDKYQYYMLFPNHHEGLKAHKYIKEAGIKCTISPTPREASKSCGISLMLEPENIGPARNIIEQNNINTEGIVKIKSKSHDGYRSC
jgi:hypothetical protein